MTEYTITHDHNATWVDNQTGLVAHFGTYADLLTRAGYWSVAEAETQADWRAWVARVSEHYAIRVGDEHKPGWLRP